MFLQSLRSALQPMRTQASVSLGHVTGPEDDAAYLSHKCHQTTPRLQSSMFRPRHRLKEEISRGAIMLTSTDRHPNSQQAMTYCGIPLKADQSAFF
jgi:hypothetical protein